MKLPIAVLIVLTLLGINSVTGQPSDVYNLASQIQEVAQKDTNSWIYDLTATKYSFIGKYDESMKAYDRTGDTGPGAFPGLLLTDCHIIDARKYIIDRSKREKVIVINEAHHQPLHRLFTTSLLDSLWTNGYRYFGLEGIADATAMNKTKRVKLSDGFYTSEPRYANMVRYALKVGFTLFAYEATGKRGTEREQVQASNIAKMMKLHPNDKFLIHCGFSHVVEANHPDWGKAMAGRLKGLTGYDPFTIDQVEMSERSQQQYESTAFQQLRVEQSSVITKNGTDLCVISNDPRKIDLKVVHPRTTYAHGRPTWLLLNKDYQYVDAKPYVVDRLFPVLVLAYSSIDDDRDVPVDVIEIDDMEDPTKLVLPRGKYRLKVIQKGATSTIVKVEVN